MGLKYILNIKKREGGRVLIKEGGAGGVKNMLQTYQKRERGFNKSNGKEV